MPSSAPPTAAHLGAAPTCRHPHRNRHLTHCHLRLRLTLPGPWSERTAVAIWNPPEWRQTGLRAGQWQRQEIGAVPMPLWRARQGPALQVRGLMSLSALLSRWRPQGRRVSRCAAPDTLMRRFQRCKAVGWRGGGAAPAPSDVILYAARSLPTTLRCAALATRFPQAAAMLGHSRATTS